MMKTFMSNRRSHRPLAWLPVFLLAGLVGAGSARAQDNRPTGKEAATDGAKDAYTVRLFKLEHGSAEAVAKALRHLGSGARDAKIEANDALDSISVRDFAANVAAIEGAVKLLDVPRPDVVFHMRLLVAGPEGATDVPADMQKVVRQLQQSLRWKAYYQVADLDQRVRSGARLESHGVLQLAPPVLEKPTRTGYEIELRPVVTGVRKGARTVQLRLLQFELESRETGRADIRTEIVVPEGETVVVGTAALGNRALVLVVWASIL